MLASLSTHDLARLVEVRTHRPRWYRFPEDRRPQDVEAGYRVQSDIHDALARTGINRVGYKIASIAVEGQRALGLSEPAYAGMYDVTQKATLREALALPLVAAMVECEIAFITRAELSADDDLSDDALCAAIGTAHLACEIVDNRYGAPLEVGIPTILTDDFFHSAFVLRAPRPGWQEVIRKDLPGITEIDGKVVHGNTADALRPLEALRWLVRKLGSHGKTLGAGEIVLAGSLVKPTPITLPATSVSIAVDGFGTLSLAD
jgi:2-keto-4-pentenoate hydratase